MRSLRGAFDGCVLGIFRFLRNRGHGMDTVWFRRLIALLVLCLLAQSAFAYQCTSYNSVMAQCNATGASLSQASSHSCVPKPGAGNANPLSTGFTSGTLELHWVRASDGAAFVQGAWAWQCGAEPPPPADPCSALAPTKFPTGGSILTGYSICGSVADPASGGLVQCKINIVPLGPPTASQGSGGMQTYVQSTPSGGQCNAGDPPGLKDGSGAPVPPAKAPTPVIPPANQDPPKLCGGTSCYDPKSNQYCATGDGGQVCVSAPSPGPAPSPGGCGTNGVTTLCAGNPEAPKPPANNVPDPPTQTRGHDDYTNIDPGTGQAGHTGVGSYSNSGSTGVSSGQGPGDKGPAPASTAGGATGKKDDGTTAGGGGDCSNPPQVGGSAALGMIATQQWRERCQLAGTFGDGKTAPPEGTHPTSADVWQDGQPSGNATADAANAGHYDGAGMGFATTCPMEDKTIDLWGGKTLTIAFSKGCFVGDWIGFIVLAFATFAAARITMGGLV